MRLMETGHPGTGHQAFRGDNVCEEEGLHAELVPPDTVNFVLEDLIIGKNGKEEEEAMQMLLMTSGAP